jgi:hypothetical protein
MELKNMYINIGANNFFFFFFFFFFFSIGTTARCGLWVVEQYPSTFSYLSPTLSIFSLLALEDLFLFPLSIYSWVLPYVSSLQFLSEDLFGLPILLHTLQVT